MGSGAAANDGPVALQVGDRITIDGIEYECQNIGWARTDGVDGRRHNDVWV